MAKSCLQVAPGRHVNSKQAARDVNHVPILDIFWSYWLTVNGRPKVNRLGTLYPIDYASQMNTACASIVTHSTGAHNRLVYSSRAIKIDRAGFVDKSRHDYRCPAVLQRDQHFVVFKLPFVAARDFMLKIDNPLAGRRDFADKR